MSFVDPTTPPYGPTRSLLERISPAWVTRYLGERLIQGVIGLLGDTLKESTMAASRSDLLAEPESPYDAVEAQGKDRVIERYPADTNATYRQRVLGAWTAWGQSGVTSALLDQVSRFGFPNALLKVPSDWDGANGYGSRKFWIILPSITEGSAGEDEVRAVFRLVNKFRAAEERVADVVGIRTGGYWGDGVGGTWGDGIGGTWGDASAVSYRSDLV